MLRAGEGESLAKVILVLVFGFASVLSSPTRAPVIHPTSYPTSTPSAQPSLYLPRLINFDFDSSVGNLTLYFDHLMEIKSFNHSMIQLQAYADIDNNFVNDVTEMKLTGVYNNLVKQGNSTRAVIMMNSLDYAILKTRPLLGNSSSSLYLSMEEGALRSAFGAEVQSISEHNAMMCDSFKADILPPFLSSYHINMNLGRLELTFSEPVDINSFTIEGLALQRSRNAKVTQQETSQYYEFFVDTDTEVIGVSNYNRTIEVNLGFQNMNAIKRAIGLAVTRETTFLSAWKPFVKDLAGNDISLVAFDKLNGVPPAEFQGDYSSPYLLHWDYDANQATISLYFSETIYYQFFNFSGIQLSNGTHAFMRVHNPVNMTPHHDFDIIRFTLAEEQRYYLESLGNVFTEPSNTYIILDQGIVVDTAYTQNIYSSNLATDLNPMQVRLFQYDHVRPRLVSCKLDLKRGFMSLRFSKSIKLSSLRMRYLSLQSAENQVVETETFHFHWEDIELLTTENGIYLEFILKPHVLVKMRTFSYLGKSTEYTYVVALRPMLTDTAFLANELIDVPTDKALQVSHLIPDETDPTLVDWSINLSTNMIVFNFSKPVELDTLQLTEAMISSDDRMIPTSLSFTLSMSQVLTTGGKTTSIVIELSQNDQLIIKSSLGFCSSNTTCYLSFSSDFVKSLRNISESGSNSRRRKDYDAIVPQSFVAPSVFVKDLVPPKVTYVTLDLDLRTLNLEFSKPVVVENANLSQFILSYTTGLTWNTEKTAIDNGVGQLNSTTLSEFCMVDGIVNTTMSITLSPEVFRNIQMLRPLGLSVKKTFLYFGSNAIADVAGNYLSPVIKQPNKIYADHQEPYLLSVYLHPTANNLTVYMSEVVNVSSLDVSSFRLISLSGYQTDLSGSALVMPDYRHSLITSYFTIDLMPIRTKLTSYQIATTQSNTFLFIAGQLMPTDSSPAANRAVVMKSGAALTDGVEFTSFHLDMNQGFILLEMSFYVELVSFSASSFILRASDFSSSYGLASISSFQLLESGPGLKIFLSKQDKTCIQKLIPLDSKDSFRILILSSAVTDVNGKKLSKTVNLPCSHLVNDRLPPYLESYVLNIAQGNIVLTFNKDIVIDSLDLDGTITFVDSLLNVTQSYIVRNLPRAKSNYLTKEVILDLNVGYPVTEREKILLKYPLGISINQTYLTMEKGLAYDNSHPPNPTEPIYLEEAMQADTVYYDAGSPTLIGFDLQLSDRILLLNFSEAIDVTTLRMDKFTLANSRDITTATYYKLTTSSKPIDYSPSSFVKVQLSDYDVNQMMYVAPRLIMSAATSFISVDLLAFKDLAKKGDTGAGNSNDPVYFRYGISVTRYFEDYVPPMLLSYNISIPDGILNMQFNEIVNCETLWTEGIRFQPYQFLGKRPKRKVNLDSSRFSAAYVDDEESYTVSLSNESYCEIENKQNFDTKLRVVISYQDMVRIKSTFNVLKAANMTYLTMKANTIRDAFGNGNEAIGDVDALPVTEFIPDTSSPQLLAFSLTSTQLMTLYFNEPVNYRTLDLTKIFYQDGKVGTGQHGYHLRKAKLYGTDTLKMILEVELLYDFFRMQISSSLFKSQYQTNIHVPSNTIKDLSNNEMVEIPSTYALTVGPRVIFWDLNLDDGYLLLEFSEVVSSEFSLAGFTIQNVHDLSSPSSPRSLPSNVNVTLTPSTFEFTSSTTNAEYLGNRFYRMELSATDLYLLKVSSVLTFPSASSSLIAPRSALYRQYPLYLTMKRNITTSIAPESFIFGLENLAILVTDALHIRYFVPDVSSPICSMFDLNLNTGTLVLYFDEPIDVTTMTLTGLTLFSTTEGNFATLGEAYDTVYNASDSYETRSFVQLVNQKNVEISLSLQDLNIIKLAVMHSNNTALDGLIMTTNACLDISGNGNIGNDPDHPIYINDFIPDTTPPELLSYEIDERTFLFTLLFDEVVNPNDLMPSDITLMNTISNLTFPNSSTSYELTNYTLVNQSDVTSLVPYHYAKRTVLLDLGFLRVDEFAIESRHKVLQQNLSRSFVYLPKMKDIFDNQITVPMIQQVDTFHANTRDVVLESFDLSSSKTLTLYFSRAMDVSTIDCSEFILTASASPSSTDIVTMTTSDCTVRTKSDQRVVVIDVDSTLFTSSSIGSAVDSTYLYTATSLANSRDIYNNKVSAITISSALRVGPQIVKVSIDLNNGELLLVFSKEILLSSAFANASSIGFYSSLTKHQVYLNSEYDISSYSNVASEYYLTTVNSARLNDSVLYVSLSTEDLSRVKLLDVKQGSFFFLLASGSCAGTDGVTNAAKTMSSKFFITRIIPDFKAPTILNITLNIGSELMMIEFDEPIRVSTFKVNNIRIQSHESVDIETSDNYIYTNASTDAISEVRVSYRLTGGTITQSLNTLIIVFNPTDANSLKLNPHFAKNMSNTFISMEYNAGSDMAGNYLESIPSTKARAVDTFIPDTSRPELLAFTLDLNHADGTTYLTLKFSEPMDISTLNITDITVQSRFAQRDGVYYRLTGGILRSTDSDTIIIELLAIDTLNMKLIPGLIRRKQSTYLIYSENMVTDLFGNKVQPEVDGYAFACTTFIADTIPPKIIHSKINMTAESITFTMNEPVILATIDVTKLTVQSKPGEIFSAENLPGATDTSSGGETIPFIRYTISNQSAVLITSPLSTTFTIQLAAQDIDSLKSLYPMTRDIYTTWFPIQQKFLTDFVGNSIENIYPRDPYRADEFIEDEIRPEVTKYQLDMNNEMIILFYSEAVYKETLNLSEIIIQSASARRFGSFIPLTNCTFTVGKLGTSKRVEISIDHNTMVYMKFHGIGADEGTSFLAYSDVSSLDYRRNRLMPAWDGSVVGYQPKLPDVLEVDSIAPKLTRWYIDRSNLFTNAKEAEIVMYFDEPVVIRHASKLFLSSTAAKTPNHPLYPIASEADSIRRTQYLNSNTEVRIILKDYCLDKHTPFKSGETCKTTFFSYLSTMNSNRLVRHGMLIGNDSIVDFAKIPNSIEAVDLKFYMLFEDGPDCNECGHGSYVSVNCTSNSDRICVPCTRCKDQYYELLSCEAYRDRSCAPCSQCRYGEYIAQSCSAEHDTVCQPCTKCAPMTYPERECSLGLDSVCNSCEQCTFGSTRAQQFCEQFSAYSKWKNENCCYDKNNKFVPCKDKLNVNQKRRPTQSSRV